ncbi:phosphoenolpyruvate hydrolase family protein [Blastococcus sp. HT6-30]|uniref:phosphoenolpyruvate hydrolase family protein n=1 Tax=Blastococcus sp. HT6-30 TaxID=3144843 RepID=UPI003219F288
MPLPRRPHRRARRRAYVLQRTEGVVGFFGASSIERLPTEIAIRTQTEAFKAIDIAR